MKNNNEYTAIILKAKEGGFTGYVEEMPGVISQGNTIEELKENLIDALQMMISYYKDETKKLLKKSKTRIHKRQALVLK